MSVQQGQDQIAQRPDRVYLTTDRELAWAYASMWTLDGTQLGGGALYRVTARDLEPDEDLLSLDGVSFQAPEATVTTVYDAHVRFDQARCARIFQRVLAAHEAARRRPER